MGVIYPIPLRNLVMVCKNINLKNGPQNVLKVLSKSQTLHLPILNFLNLYIFSNVHLFSLNYFSFLYCSVSATFSFQFMNAFVSSHEENEKLFKIDEEIDIREYFFSKTAHCEMKKKNKLEYIEFAY